MLVEFSVKNKMLSFSQKYHYPNFEYFSIDYYAVLINFEKNGDTCDRLASQPIFLKQKLLNLKIEQNRQIRKSHFYSTLTIRESKLMAIKHVEVIVTFM